MTTNIELKVDTTEGRHDPARLNTAHPTPRWAKVGKLVGLIPDLESEGGHDE